MRIRSVALIAAAVLLAGCARGPKTLSRRPDVPTPQVFRGAQELSATSGAESVADLKWFELFKDEQLQALIRTALQDNFDVRDAAVRVQAARANLGITRSNQLPGLSAGADVTTQRISNTGSFPLPEGFEQTRTITSAALSLLSYEIDIWGKLRTATEASRRDLLASEEAQRAVASTLVGEVASAYFNLLSLDTELEVARRTLTTRESSLRLIRDRERSGLASLLEVRQGEQLVYTAAQAIPSLERQIEQTENQISLLLGGNPAPVKRGLPLTEQPQPPSVPPGLPSALLARRPDIRALERSMEAAEARIYVARTAYYPSISLTSFLGTQSDQLSSLFKAGAGVWQFVPRVTQPIFTGGRTGAQVRLSQANQRLTLVEYERTIQTAFREVSDALVQRQKAQELRATQERLVDTLKDRSRLSYLRYRGGVDTLLNALDADRDLFEAELGLAQARRDELLALVQLYRALGGGWQS